MYGGATVARQRRNKDSGSQDEKRKDRQSFVADDVFCWRGKSWDIDVIAVVPITHTTHIKQHTDLLTKLSTVLHHHFGLVYLFDLSIQRQTFELENVLTGYKKASINANHVGLDTKNNYSYDGSVNASITHVFVGLYAKLLPCSRFPSRGNRSNFKSIISTPSENSAGASKLVQTGCCRCPNWREFQ